MGSERASQRAFVGVSALLFAASAAGTIVWRASMSAMGGMPMPGGWTMSMAWMRMPGQGIVNLSSRPAARRNPAGFRPSLRAQEFHFGRPLAEANCENSFR